MEHQYLQAAINISDNTIVSIYEVPPGLNPNYVCPICGEPLIAKNKNKLPNKPLKENERIAHFAHQNNTCSNAGETILHRIAKEVLSQSKKLMLPSLHFNFSKINEAKTIEFEISLSEERIYLNHQYKVVDSILIKNGKKLLVEFYKTHLVEENKIDFIRKCDLSCIEIDLNGISVLDKKGSINKLGVKNFLENSFEDRYWLNNIKLNKLKDQKNNLRKAEALKSLNNSFLQDELFSDDFSPSYIYFQDYDYERIKMWKTKLKAEGYIFRKIYGNYYSSRKVYCPLLKNAYVNTIELDSCKNCEHYKNMGKNDNYDWCVVCGKK